MLVTPIYVFIKGNGLVLIKHGFEDELVVGNLLRLEPEADLVLGAVGSIRSVDDVASNGDAKVTADGAGLRVVGVGGTNQLASLEDDVLALPNHGDDGAAAEVLAETRVERLGFEVNVVLLGHILSGVDELEGNELVSAVLEAADDLSNQVALDTVGLDGDESTLSLGTSLTVVGCGSSVERGCVVFCRIT